MQHAEIPNPMYNLSGTVSASRCSQLGFTLACVQSLSLWSRHLPTQPEQETSNCCRHLAAARLYIQPDRPNDSFISLDQSLRSPYGTGRAGRGKHIDELLETPVDVVNGRESETADRLDWSSASHVTKL